MDKKSAIKTILDKHYGDSMCNRRFGLQLLLESEMDKICSPANVKDGVLPLDPAHICFKHGHAMYSVYSFTHIRFANGMNKCSRCGHEEEWQYDF